MFAFVPVTENSSCSGIFTTTEEAAFLPEFTIPIETEFSDYNRIYLEE